MGPITRLLDKEDIWNADEFGLFYKMPPDCNIFQRKLTGRKEKKTLATELAYCNAAGQQKLPTILIEPAAKPRCFNKTGAEQLGFDYHHNLKSWMATSIPFDRLHRLNSYTERNRGRRGLLLLKKCSALD